MDTVLNIALYAWASVGVVVLFVYFLLRAGKKQWWSHALWATVIYFIGIAYLAGGYGEVAGIVDMIKGTANIMDIINTDTFSTHEKISLYVYIFTKYIVKTLFFGLVMVIFGLASGLGKKFFIMVATISIAAIVGEVGLNLNNLIKYESYISVGLISLYLFLKVCKKLFWDSRKTNEDGEESWRLKTLVASLVAFCFSLGFDAWAWRYVDGIVYGMFTA